ncbi:MAG: filamentous hemagglutinin N-terminal domain-containing protein, partial [Desulfuromonadaceae bacterium]|nr:filamentous hemagglutinin N-terminal domain-containing protein [Desulfuromonadaceae bacterium]
MKKQSINSHFGLSRNQRRIAASFMLVCFLPTASLALPALPQVVNGAANISTSGNAMTVTNSAGAIINWQSFSIGQNESARFIQPSAASAVLNRITGGDPSKILGVLQSNGKVLLINPNGILFGQNARVDVGGLIASTLNITNQDFLAGRYNFRAGAAAGKIENQGTITTPGAGEIYLIAADVTNSGVITATNGDILLAAGKEVMLVDKNNPEIAMVVTAPEHQSINLGTLVADAGRIGMYGGIVRQKGRISADSAVKEGGKIFLKATKSIELSDSSFISADGAKGGEIIVKTEENGNISGTLTARGELSARGDGTSGSGGFIETSAAKVDIKEISIATSGGKWLIDPVDVSISGTGNDVSTGGAFSPASSVDVNTLVTALNNGSSITIDTEGGTGGNGDITVASPITVAPATTGAMLTLNAYRNININQDITATSNPLNLNLNANLGFGSGTSNTNKAIDLNGGTLTFTGGNFNLTTGATLANATVSSTGGNQLS